MSFRACWLAGAGRLEAGSGSWKGFQIHCSSTASPTAGFCMNQGLKSPAACLFVPIMRFEPISPMIFIWWGGLKDIGYLQVSQKGQLNSDVAGAPPEGEVAVCLHTCVCTCVCK